MAYRNACVSIARTVHNTEGRLRKPSPWPATIVTWWVGVRTQDNVFDAAGFDGLLTDYDRMLLGFGMHISWQL